MTLKEMISDVRARVRELAPRELTDDLIRHWLNEGQLDFARKTLCLASRAKSVTTAGDAVYALPSDLLRLREVKYGVEKLFEIPLADAVDTEGVPTGYAKLGQTSILLSPVPSAEGQLEIIYYQTPDKLVNPGDESILPTTCHEAVVLYATIRAYEATPNLTEGQIAVSDRLTAQYNAKVQQQAGQFRQRKTSAWTVIR
ncbi:MAG TPA: hypothetical protein PLD73_14455 [Candidatus Hydrogenedentes bacterium]|nr:hypothetical protein [Candidatus Hydrogenedentota bacterium]